MNKNNIKKIYTVNKTTKPLHVIVMQNTHTTNLHFVDICELNNNSDEDEWVDWACTAGLAVAGGPSLGGWGSSMISACGKPALNTITPAIQLLLWLLLQLLLWMALLLLQLLLLLLLLTAANTTAITAATTTSVTTTNATAAATTTSTTTTTTVTAATTATSTVIIHQQHNFILYSFYYLGFYGHIWHFVTLIIFDILGHGDQLKHGIKEETAGHARNCLFLKAQTIYSWREI